MKARLTSILCTDRRARAIRWSWGMRNSIGCHTTCWKNSDYVENYVIVYEKEKRCEGAEWLICRCWCFATFNIVVCLKIGQTSCKVEQIPLYILLMIISWAKGAKGKRKISVTNLCRFVKVRYIISWLPPGLRRSRPIRTELGILLPRFHACLFNRRRGRCCHYSSYSACWTIRSSLGLGVVLQRLQRSYKGTFYNASDNRSS